MPTKTNILITSAGRRVTLIKAFELELKALIPGSKVFATDSNPGLSAGSMMANDFFQTPRITEKNFIPYLINLCEEHEIGLLIPTLDPELLVLSRHIQVFQQAGIHILISDQKLIEIFDSKIVTTNFFDEMGIDAPKIYTKDAYQFPLYVKPIDGSASKDNYVVKEPAFLCEHFLKDTRLAFFEYISPQDYEEYTCDLYYSREGELKCVVPRIRLEVRSGESSKGVTRKNHLIQFVKDKLSHIPGARGCLTAQFFAHKSSDTDIKGVEINARFGGGYPLSYFAGANYPKWAIQEYILNQEIEYFEDWEENLLMLRYDSELLIHEFK
ncbi:ATP-grasp domain-containing protein [Muriicola marianensis]|uniref:Carbamoyl phosphate synthase large subunit n=1 Tax=Muriicola marianensis TaxID=1324801 RepID=A0ABQ1QQF5_9FLAO|nr:ATP-grasp domain-containing protein [Muriicola marianensis]GGD40793.1 carbamoyl phosphate synthase large subunit [Muriicola marianensis]